MVFFSALDFNKTQSVPFCLYIYIYVVLCSVSAIWKKKYKEPKTKESNARILFFWVSVCLQTEPMYTASSVLHQCRQCYSTVSPSQNHWFVFSLSLFISHSRCNWRCVATINKEISWKCFISSSSSSCKWIKRNEEKTNSWHCVTIIANGFFSIEMKKTSSFWVHGKSNLFIW